MHGLMGDRLLKRFLKGIRRKSAIASTKETGPDSGAEMTHRSKCPENDHIHGKEEEENIEKTYDQKDVLDMTSGATQSLDDLQKTK